MRIHSILALSLLSVSAIAIAGAPQQASVPRGNTLADLAQRALSPDPTIADPAIDALRGAGYAGIDAFWLEASAKTGAPFHGSEAKLDRICKQHDCRNSLLYWHTDLEAAKAESAASGKPILSLRLLGNLDEELSCANSRFFRTTLYPNAAVRKTLRETFVLHWESVRAVPKVRIDFGDGRILERTLTGNSIHYVLDSKGRPVDGIPGMHGANGFLAQLERARRMAIAVDGLDDAARTKALASLHGNRREAVHQEWKKELRFRGVQGPLDSHESLQKATTPELWQSLANDVLNDARLDPNARGAVSTTFPRAWDAGQIAVTKSAVENPLLRQFEVLERSLALDGLKNEWALHPILHAWFERQEVTDTKSLNERVYGALFLMPLDDPWLGLSPNESFSAIANDGRIVVVR